MISALSFLADLNWIDGKPLQIEPYRADIFRRALDLRYDGIPLYSMVLAGRAKKNYKSADLILAGLYCLVCRESPQGSDVLLVANDEDQAGADLDLAKKIVGINPDLASDLEILSKEIRRRDGRGTMRVLPANNAIGQHGLSYVFLGYDEIHGYRSWALMEALQPDPSRSDVLQWITSYDSIYDTEGCPLHDLKKIGVSGEDLRMLFSWYSADLCTDPAFADLPPDQRANPSMSSWPEGAAYLEQQRRRLPSARFRRLHHNLPGAPQGAFFDQGVVEASIIAGRQAIEPQAGVDYLAFVDMSGGSADDATLAIAHWNGEKAVLDLLISQAGCVPFNPRLAVARFAAMCHRYRCHSVHGDDYGGSTFKHDFAECRVDYISVKQSKSEIYEGLEVGLNANQVELPDIAKLRQQLLTLVVRGASIDHQSGAHDDWANAAAGALVLVNPNVGGAEGWIRFYRDMPARDAAKEAAAPAPSIDHGFLQQISPKPRGEFVRVLVPSDCSTIYGASGVSYNTEIVDGVRICWMSPEDSKVLVCGSSSLSWRESNQHLVAQLGRLEPPRPGIRIADVLQAARDAVPRDPRDIGGMSRGIGAPRE